jgi:branched-chain amino acid aminotransferase
VTTPQFRPVKKNGVYVNIALAKTDAMLADVDDAIVLNQDGHVSEGSAANLTIVRDGVVITLPVNANPVGSKNFELLLPSAHSVFPWRR